MTVIPFPAARKPHPEPSCGCPTHRLEALADRVQAAHGDLAGELLWPNQAELLTDVVATITAVLDGQRRRSDARR